MLFWISVFSRLKLMPNTINFVLSTPKCALNSLSTNQSNKSDSSNLVLLDHQFLQNNRTLGIEKMNYKDIYSIIISSKVNTLTSRIYFEKFVKSFIPS